MFEGVGECFRPDLEPVCRGRDRSGGDTGPEAVICVCDSIRAGMSAVTETAAIVLGKDGGDEGGLGSGYENTKK